MYLWTYNFEKKKDSIFDPNKSIQPFLTVSFDPPELFQAISQDFLISNIYHYFTYLTP